MIYRATDDEKAEFVAICKAHNLKPGTFNRNILEKVIADYRRQGAKSLRQYLPRRGAPR